MNRRDFLQRIGLGAFALLILLPEQAHAKRVNQSREKDALRARDCGGPCHIDFFDVAGMDVEGARGTLYVLCEQCRQQQNYTGIPIDWPCAVRYLSNGLRIARRRGSHGPAMYVKPRIHSVAHIVPRLSTKRTPQVVTYTLDLPSKRG